MSSSSANDTCVTCSFVIWPITQRENTPFPEQGCAAPAGCSGHRTHFKARGVNDILIAVVDGLKGFPEAITAVFPQTQVSMRAMDQAERECSNEDDDLQREICIVLVFTPRLFK